jgi:hypothetical protein
MSEQISNEVLAERLESVKSVVQRVEGAVSDLTGAVQNLVRVEANQVTHTAALERAFAVLDKQDERLKVVEKDMPGLREMRVWIVAGVLAIVALVGGGIVTDRIEVRAGKASMKVESVER